MLQAEEPGKSHLPTAKTTANTFSQGNQVSFPVFVRIPLLLKIVIKSLGRRGFILPNSPS